MTAEDAIKRLAEYRRDIDELDLRILELLNERTKIVEKIGSVKHEFAMPVYEPKREDEVFANVMSRNHGPLPPEAVKRIFERVIDEMRTLQKMKMMENSK